MPYEALLTQTQWTYRGRGTTLTGREPRLSEEMRFKLFLKGIVVFPRVGNVELLAEGCPTCTQHKANLPPCSPILHVSSVHLISQVHMPFFLSSHPFLHFHISTTGLPFPPVTFFLFYLSFNLRSNASNLWVNQIIYKGIKGQAKSSSTPSPWR